MSRNDAGQLVTELHSDTINANLLQAGHSIRHIETWNLHGDFESFIVWDCPALTEADLPY